MFEDFRPWNIPVLFSATGMLLSWLWPLFGKEAPRNTMVEYSLPPRIAELLYLFYFRRQYDAVDTIMAVMGFYLAVLDPYVLWRLESKPRCIFTGVSAFGIGMIGYYGQFNAKTRF